MYPNSVGYNPIVQHSILDSDKTPEKDHSTSGAECSTPLREIEMMTMSSSASVSQTRFTRNEFQLGDSKQILKETVGQLESEIRNSNSSASEKTEKLEHLKVLEHRSSGQLQRLTSNLKALYGDRHDFKDVFKRILQTFIAGGLERPSELKELDKQRENNPNWFASNKSIEATLYVDRHCKTLDNLEKEINLFKSLNVNILHLMPTIYKLPAGDNDGGYAISDFRTVDPDIGTMDQLRDVFTSMRKHGISPAMDVTVNHTSHEHPWAEAAKAGDPEKQGFYFLMSEAEKNEYQPNLIDVFPDIRKGSFTWNKDTSKFVWTTFKSSQWDLNYNNPKVLAAMANELMFLANQGAEMLRFDAVPLISKKKGTNCLYQENVPHILQTFNVMQKIAAPGMIFKSEAIDEPKLIKPYVGHDLCQLGYNATLPFHLWDALKHQDSTFLSAALTKHMQTPEGRVWVNYTRCHDELAAKFDSDLAKESGIDRRQRSEELAHFYSGATEGSFSKGKLFLSNPASGTVSATQGSLAGVEQALQNKDPQQIEAAVNRIKLLNSVVMSVPGIPLINLTGGDDRGQINDYSYLQDSDKKHDSRWLHRPMRDIDFKQKDALEVQVMDKVFTDLAELTRIRAQDMPAFGAGLMQVVGTGKNSVLGFIRENDQQKVMVLANFSDKPQPIDSKYLSRHNMVSAIDKISQEDAQALNLDTGIELAPYQSMWLVPVENKT